MQTKQVAFIFLVLSVTAAGARAQEVDNRWIDQVVALYNCEVAQACDVALAMVEDAAEDDDPRFERILGTMYESGGAVPQDYIEAVRLYRHAAALGDAEAQASLGRMYYEGRGVPQDFLRAYVLLNIGVAGGAVGFEGQTPPAYQRDWAASELSAARLEQAQELSREWFNNPSLIE